MITRSRALLRATNHDLLANSHGPSLASLRRSFSCTPLRQAAASDHVRKLTTLDTDADHVAAREWLDNFTLEDIPKSSYESSYARSSGAGGQHVNKTNSKAVVHCDIHRAKGDWLPPFVIPALQKTAYYHPPNLLFTSQTTRSAPQNLSHALRNLHETIVASGRSLIRGQTSEAQKERVRNLAKAEDKRRREMKDKLKSKKESRRKDW